MNSKTEFTFYTHTPTEYQIGTQTDHGIVEKVEYVNNGVYAVYCQSVQRIINPHKGRVFTISNVAKTIGLYTCVAWKVWLLSDLVLAIGITLLVVSWYTLKASGVSLANTETNKGQCPECGSSLLEECNQCGWTKSAV